ncbi:MAG: hypothetical protein A3G34_12855 [Candidatus Lindowbacteria bacterium RIFCSPLOWO2_12_FULL_62_27]|nr:MAG: hypothetical protein A3G34_12855 [Candidatus Lindowbacteria bacterium RIFCSPLOWO2_12_FULL_62_27]
MGRNKVAGGLLLPALICLIGFIVYRDFLSGEKIFLFKDIGSDTINEHYPQYAHMSEYLRTDGLPRWSFQQGLGQNIFPYSLNEPGAMILSVFRRDQIPYAIIHLHFIKLIAAGLIFSAYLLLLDVSAFASVLGGLLYAFCGCMIVGGTWSTPGTECIYAALLLYAAEAYFKRGRWGLIPVVMAAIGIYQPFYFYVYTVFFFIYVTLRFREDHGGFGKPYGILAAKLTAMGFLGLCMSAVYCMSGVLQMLQSPRVGGEASYFSKLVSQPVFAPVTPLDGMTLLLRLFSSDLLGTGSGFRGWGNYYEAPELYCGLVSLLLAPQFFALVQKKPTRRLCGLFCLAVFLALLFPFFRHMFWLFSGNEYRTISLFLTLLILFLGVRALSLIDTQSRVDVPLLIGTLLVLLAALYFPWPVATVDRDLRGMAAGFLAADAILIYAVGTGKFKTMFRACLLAAVAAELSWFSIVSTHSRPVITGEEVRQKSGYNDYTVDAVARLNATDTGFFRVLKDYSSSPAEHRGLNDAKIQGYRGTSSYYSFNQLHYIRFLSEVGIIDARDELATHWAYGLERSPVLLSLVGVKYFLSKSKEPHMLRYGYQQREKIGDVHIYENKFSLPLGVTYASCQPYGDFKRLDPASKVTSLMYSAVTEDNRRDAFAGIEVVRDPPAISSMEEYGRRVDRLKENAMAIRELRQNHIRGTITIGRKKILFLSIPYDEGWAATVDGQPRKLQKINVGFMGLALDAGDHEIDLTFEPPLARVGAGVTFVGLLVYGFLMFRTRSTYRR